MVRGLKKGSNKAPGCYLDRVGVRYQSEGLPRTTLPYENTDNKRYLNDTSGTRTGFLSRVF